MAASCAVCGRAVNAADAEREHSFCCAGCRDVARELGTPEDADAERRSISAESDAPAGSARTFLRVDGMHSATCEAYLESVAESVSGVDAAEASYVTETVRVDHDSDAVSARDLRAELSTTGYTAYLRDEAGDSDGDSAGTRRDRELSGVRKRRSDEILGFRYAAGIVFGAFLMIPYVSVLYPTHLAAHFDHAVLDAFEGFELGGGGGFLFLRVYFALTAVVLFFTGMPVLRGAYVGLKMRRPTTDLVVAVTVVSAFCYSTGAVLLGRIDIYFDVTLATAAAVTGAAFYESSVKQRALNRLTELTVSEVSDARRYDADGETTRIPVDDLEGGDRILVREGERIPVDGTLVGDTCTVAEAVVTGESVPIVKRPGDDVVGGAVVTADAAVVEVDAPVTSSIERITNALWTIQSADHGVQRRADRLSKYVIPVVVAAAVGAAILTAFGGSETQAVMAGLLSLVVTSPWALGLATPLAVATSIRDAMRRGVIVLDETIFERLRDVDTVVFDKTGTLTAGEMDVVRADAPEEALEAAAALERHAAHPAAAAIVSAFGASAEDSGEDSGGIDERSPSVSRFETHANGISGTVDGDELLVGNRALFADRGWPVDEALESAAEEARGFGRLPVIVGREGRAVGHVVVGDEPRDGWADTVSRLSERGIDVVVLTGDDPESADFFARKSAAVSHVFAGVPPAGKTAAIRRLQTEGRVAMVGDGTNDAPALAQADLGISLGSGTALAADAADITIVDDDLSAVETAFRLASAANRRVTRTLGFALTYNVVAVSAVLVGLFNPLTAAGAILATGGLIAVNCWRDLLGG